MIILLYFFDKIFIMEFLIPRCVLLLGVIIFCNAGCGTILESGVNSADKAAVVNKHNEVRKLIATGKVPGQPRGINLKKFVWDDKLAKAAQDIANTCIFEHKKVEDSRWYVGQNLYKWSTTGNTAGADWNSAVLAWFNEYKTYTFSNRVYNHYTQVVWANTQYVGCGYIYYNDSGNWKSKYYVCNYGPGGNIIGSYPYQTGNSGCENLC